MEPRYLISFWLSKIILRSLDNDKKAKFRELEKTSIKLTETRSHQLFNKCCMINNLLPTYTNVNLHDEAARTENFTLEFRRKLIRRQIEQQGIKITELEATQCTLKREIADMMQSSIHEQAILLLLQRIIESKELSLMSKHNNKLVALNGGPVLRKEPRRSFLNLSTIEIEQDLSEIFDLGMNCHVRSKYDMLMKKIEVEKLYRGIADQKTRNKIYVTDDERLKCELKRFSLRELKDFSSDVLTKEQHNKIKEFNNNENIIVRKADKSNLLVIMNKEDYASKIDLLLADSNKFQRVGKDPTPKLKKKLRSLISTIHAKEASPKFPNLIGHYQPGYIYGNPKVHKDENNPPLRPIISQIGTPTYEVAKRLNEILTPSIPAKHMIKSTQEFIDISRAFKSNGYLASLDVESLFTNVPVDDTIQIILEHAYGNASVTPPDIPKEIMKTLLKTCTTETPFYNIYGDIYIQRDKFRWAPLLARFSRISTCASWRIAS